MTTWFLKGIKDNVIKYYPLPQGELAIRLKRELNPLGSVRRV